MKTIILLHVCCIVLACSAGLPAEEMAIRRGHVCQYDGRAYAFIITESAYASMVKWRPAKDNPNPPLSVFEAGEIATRGIGNFAVKADQAWAMESIGFEPVGEWYVYIVSFRLGLKSGPSTGVWPEMRVLVLMDGTFIDPVVTEVAK